MMHASFSVNQNMHRRRFQKVSPTLLKEDDSCQEGAVYSQVASGRYSRQQNTASHAAVYVKGRGQMSAM